MRGAGIYHLAAAVAGRPTSSIWGNLSVLHPSRGSRAAILLEALLLPVAGNCTSDRDCDDSEPESPPSLPGLLLCGKLCVDCD